MVEKMIEFWCVKHRGKVSLPEDKLEKVDFRKGIKAWKGKCPKDDTNMYRIIAKEKKKI